MIDHIIDIGERPAKLSVDTDLLIIQNDKGDKATIPFSDIRALIVSHTRVTYTNAVLSRLCSHGGILVVCDERHQPVGMTMPLISHSTQAERFAQQAAVSGEIKDRAWQQIIRSKLLGQGKMLKRLHGGDRGLSLMAGKIRPGDPDNLEARAAKKYWPAIFNDASFHRDPAKDGLNSWLNYGYVVLRALVARAICATGLHPCLGLHHHNRYDPFPLASDLMEPFRTLVDAHVAKLLDDFYPPRQLTKEIKSEILKLFTQKIQRSRTYWTFFSFISMAAQSLIAFFQKDTNILFLPEWDDET